MNEASICVQPKIRPWQHVAIFLAACAIVISRRPDSVFHAQFYAEDGAIWFAEAYNWGAWKALFWTYNGYIHVLPRFAAAVALLAPFRYAPLIENLVAIAFQALPVNLLLSSRSSVWGTLRFRVALALIYLALPNTGEMIGTVTESQWTLALCAFLLVVAVPPRSVQAKIFDIAILSLASLTGPFCVVLFFIVLFLPKEMKSSWRRLVAAIFLAGSLVQLCELIVNRSGRYAPALGASPKLFIQILSQIYISTLLGSNTLASILSLKVLSIIVISGSLIILCAGRLSPVMRRFLFLSSALFIASLARPITSQIPNMSAWQILAVSPGVHYWYFPTLAFAWSIAFCLRSRNQLFQIAAGLLAVLMFVGLARDYRCPTFPDTHFAQNIAHFQTLPKGSEQIIPLNPSGWSLLLIKK